jgi:hypothetical protein
MYRICSFGLYSYFCAGELAEWSIAAVLKTVDCYRSAGSNPPLSAKVSNLEKAWNRKISGFFVKYIEESFFLQPAISSKSRNRSSGYDIR